MRRNRAIVVIVLVAIGLPGSIAAADYRGPGFSGVVYAGQDEAMPQKLGTMRVGPHGMRLDLQHDGQRVASLILWNSDRVISLLLDHKVYFEVPPDQLAMDPYEDRPCAGYESERRIGTEAVDGRSAEKWRCRGERNPRAGRPATDATAWYDRELRFQVRVVKDNGEIFELRDVRIGTPNASLFEIPAGYSRLDYETLMQQQGG